MRTTAISLCGFNAALLLAATPSAQCFAQESASKKAGNSLQTVTVALDWAPSTNHTGMYAAKQRGFYAAEKLDPKLIQPTQTTTTRLVASGKAEFGVSFTHDLLQARAQGIPIVSIAAIIQENTSCFAARKGVGLKSMKDFEGKRYGGWGSPEENLKIEFLMKKAGADFGKLKIVTTGISDFIPSTQKNADIMWIYMGWDGVKAKLAGVPIDALCVRDLEPTFNTHSPLVIVSEKTIKQRPQMVKAFLAATSKGYDLAAKEPDAAAKDLLAQVPELDAKLVQESARYLAPGYAKGAKKWGLQDGANLQRYIDWTKSNKLVEKFDSVDKYFTNSFLP